MKQEGTTSERNGLDDASIGVRMVTEKQKCGSGITMLQPATHLHAFVNEWCVRERVHKIPPALWCFSRQIIFFSLVEL